MAPTPPVVIVTEPAPEPEFVIVPELFTEVVVSVMPAAVALLLLRIKFPVPVTPPDTVKTEVPAVLVRVVPPLATVRAVVLIVSAEPVLFCSIEVTFAPTPPLITLSPEDVPALVIVPIIFIGLVEIVVIPVALALSVRLPVPVIPPVMVISSPAVAGFIVRS